MDEKTKRMTAKEFRELGLLAEMNRVFLHPIGLAMEVFVNTETGEEAFGFLWDYRDDPEGLGFDDTTIRDKKLKDGHKLYLKLKQEKLPKRVESFGGVIQPLPDDINE